MRLRVEVDQASLSVLPGRVVVMMSSHKQTVHEAMARRLWQLVRSNFGTAGVDRPIHWPRLTPNYAKKVRREVATLVVTGVLRDAIDYRANPALGEVSVDNADVPYATVHQFGGGNNIPARPYFPIDDSGDLMPYSRSEVVEAGQKALLEALS